MIPLKRALHWALALCLSLCCVLSASAAHASSCASGQPIRLGGLDWESGQIVTAILARILEDGYGCRTDVVPGSTTALETALLQDDIQIIAEQWIGRSDVMTRAVQEKRAVIVGDTLAGGAVQGWYIPRYLREQHPDLKSVDDLGRFAHLFPNPEQPGKARFLNCPAGWVCETFNTRLLEITGLGKQYSNVRPGTGAALDAEITASIGQQKPVLFYYWQPSGLMAKHDLVPLEFPAYDKACWDHLLKADSRHRCVSGFPVSQLAMAVSTSFHQQHPDLVSLIERIQFQPDLLNRQILEMTENKRSGVQQADIFLRDHPEVWQPWVSPQMAASITRGVESRLRGGKADKAQTNGDASTAEDVQPEAPRSFFPAWSVADELNRSLARTVRDHGEQFRIVSRSVLDHLLLPMERGLMALPPWLVLAVLGLVGWHAMRRIVPAALCVAGFYLVGAMGLWGALMQTLALLVASSIFVVLLGLPLGILMARSDRLHRAFTPVLDIIQTMPSFVYLIPVLMLFGIGKVPALFATIVYAVAPLIRLTALGIRQVDRGLTEAARSFGSTHWQILRWVQLPQARPSIMAGINQAVMMSLGMVVVASMIGARGLGEPVLQAIQTLNIGQGVQAGAAIVILAIVIDRITQAYGRASRRAKSH